MSSSHLHNHALTNQIFLWLSVVRVALTREPNPLEIYSLPLKAKSYRTSPIFAFWFLNELLIVYLRLHPGI